MLFSILLWTTLSLLCPLSIGFFLQQAVPKSLPINVHGNVILYGTGLASTTNVLFSPIDNNSDIILTPESKSSTQIIVNVSSPNVHFATIQISKDNGATYSDSRLFFQFYEQPIFSCCNPAIVPFSGRFRTTINGANFFFSQAISIKLVSPWTTKTIKGNDLIQYVDSSTVTFKTPATTYSTNYEGNDFTVTIYLAMNGHNYVEMSSGPGLEYITKDPIKIAFIYLGLISDFGWTFAQNMGRKAIEMQYQDSIQTDYDENVSETDYAASLNLIKSYCERNFSFVFTGSYDFMLQAEEASKLDVCKQKPTHLLSATGIVKGPNLSSLFGKVYQSKYLAGMTAGYMLGKTPRGKMCVGYLGGLNIPEVYRGFNAFLLGCQKANPNCTVHVLFLQVWDDIDLERDAAIYMWEEEKCDIIAQETDSAQPSKVYKKKGGYSIGYNSDQSATVSDTVLTSPYVKWGALFSHFIDKLLNGESMEGIDYWPGMTDDAVSLWPFSNRVDVITRSRVTEAWQELQSGQRKIFCNRDQPLILQNNQAIDASSFNSDCLHDGALLGGTFALKGVVYPAPKKTKWGDVLHNSKGYENVPTFKSPNVPTFKTPIEMSIIFLLIASIGFVLTCAAGVYMFLHRQSPWFVEHLISQLWIILAGNLLLFVLPFLVWPEPTEELCTASHCLMHLIIFLIVPAICLKTLHLHLKYTTKQREISKDQNKHESKTGDGGSSLATMPSESASADLKCELDGEENKNFTENPQKLLLIHASILIVYVIYVSVWLSMEPPIIEKTYISTVGLHISECSWSYFELILFIPEVMCLLFALNLKLVHPKTPKKFNEVKYIGFSLYTIVNMGVIVVPLIIFFGKDYPLLSDFLANFGILVIAYILLFSLFGIKIAKVKNKVELVIHDSGRDMSISSKVSVRRPGSGIYTQGSDFGTSGVSQNVSSANMHTFSDTNSPPVSTYNLDSSSKPLKKPSDVTG